MMTVGRIIWWEMGFISLDTSQISIDVSLRMDVVRPPTRIIRNNINRELERELKE